MPETQLRSAGRGGVRVDADPGDPTIDEAWPEVRQRLRSRGLRWTSQRRLILDVLGGASGHVTGSGIVDRCRAVDPETTASTVYRTLAVLEELGYLRHSHGVDGHEEFHVLPEREHAHLRCASCGRTWELGSDEARALLEPLERARGFRVQVGHLTIDGLCDTCTAPTAPITSPR